MKTRSQPLLVLAGAWLLCWQTVGNSHAASPGQEVIIVYNKRMPDSQGVAEHYAERRQVPKDQIFGFELSTNEIIGRSEFRDTLQRPLAKELQERKLWRITSSIAPPTNEQPGRIEWRVTESRVRYAVLCYGVPLKISNDPNLKEPVNEPLRAELQRNDAAVDSELATLPLIESGLPLAGPLRNPGYSMTNGSWFHPSNGVLMVGRLDGPTAGIARGLVDKALEAETFGMWGRAYFDVRKTTDEHLKPGDLWIQAAAELCRRLGFETILDDNSETFAAGFPMSQIGIYVGWYDENVSGPLAQPVVEFMPGAFAYHIHSFSAGSLRTTARHWVGPLLAKGATMTMGAVEEPFLAGTPDVPMFIAGLTVHKFSFGEAAYASQAVLSWQMTVVGDPLYRPFAKQPDQFQRELERGRRKELEWSYLMQANLNLANGSPPAEWANRLEQLELTKKSAVLSEKLGDIYNLQGKPSSASNAYNQALKLQPSRLQAVRLRLLLAERLLSQDRTEEAYTHYQELLKQTPDYPDKPSIYRKLLPLAQKLNKKADAEKYEAELRQP